MWYFIKKNDIKKNDIKIFKTIAKYNKKMNEIKKYLKDNKTNYEFNKTLFYGFFYYSNIKNLDLIKEYLYKIIELDNSNKELVEDIINKLKKLNLVDANNKEIGIKKFFNNDNIIYELFHFYKELNNISKVEEYYQKAINIKKINFKLHKHLLHNYAMFLEKNNKKELAMQIMLKASKYNNLKSTFYYANYIAKISKKKSLIYYEKCIKLLNKKENYNHEDKMHIYNNYGLCFEKTGNLEKAKYYYLKAIELNNNVALDNYIKIEKNISKCVSNLKIIQNLYNNDIIHNLFTYSDIILNYINSNKKIGECYICYENDIELIELKCKNNHYICSNNCYDKIYNDRCPFCRK